MGYNYDKFFDELREQCKKINDKIEEMLEELKNKRNEMCENKWENNEIINNKREEVKQNEVLKENKIWKKLSNNEFFGKTINLCEEEEEYAKKWINPIERKVGEDEQNNETYDNGDDYMNEYGYYYDSD